MPIGSITASGVDLSNEGFILCDGRAVSRSDYAELFAKVGTTFGSGDGSTTFNIPNLSDKFIEGTGTNQLGTVKNAGLPNITGSLSSPIFVNGISVQSIGSGVIQATKSSSNRTSIDAGSYYQYDFSIDASKKGTDPVYGKSDTVQPPSVCLYYFIKARNINTGTLQNAIDDTKITASNAWSAEKVNDEITNASKRFPDYVRGTIHSFNYNTPWTATEDCYFSDVTITYDSNDNTNYHTKVNSVDITELDSTTGSPTLKIYSACGFAKKGDVIVSTPRCKIYGLKA